jgi:hypothetical protein
MTSDVMAHRSRDAPVAAPKGVIWENLTMMNEALPVAHAACVRTDKSGEHATGKYTLVDCKTGLIYGPFKTCAMARARAEHEAIATWDIIADDERLVDWRGP